MAPKSIEEARNRAEQGIQKSWDAMGSLMGLVDDLDSFNQELKRILEGYKNIPNNMTEIPISPGFSQGAILFQNRNLRRRRTVANREFRANCFERYNRTRDMFNALPRR